jgi:hypothetical protein
VLQCDISSTNLALMGAWTLCTRETTPFNLGGAAFFEAWFNQDAASAVRTTAIYFHCCGKAALSAAFSIANSNRLIDA